MPLLASALIQCILQVSHTPAHWRALRGMAMHALSRSVAVTRTPLVDSGLGAVLSVVFTKNDEGWRVVHPALAAVCIS